MCHKTDTYNAKTNVQLPSSQSIDKLEEDSNSIYLGINICDS